MTIAPERAIERRRLRVSGVVQGVGFRPFVHRLAHASGLGGFVLNEGGAVVIEVEGEPEALAGLAVALRAEAPALARIDAVASEALAPRGERRFEVRTSGAAGAIEVPPDIATCEECLEELFSPANRRYRYPFLNCTACGPRFTIVIGAPYDRQNTTMARFPLCAACRAEYEDPSDRRFHAEPIACADCGPTLSLRADGQVPLNGEAALSRAADLIRESGVVAIKGLGGYHLACDARDEDAVARLRDRKHRERKPFAVMTANPGALGEVGPEEARLLQARERPIVLVRRSGDQPLAPSVAPGNPWLAVMLPYTPVHHLLLADLQGPLVMTSANRSDEPIAFEDSDAEARLGGIADAFLSHDRAIHRRCEDSVVRVGFTVRRSRGLAPSAIPLPVATQRPSIAVGAELKATFCVARGAHAFCSPHLGDLSGELAYRAFRSDLELYLEMLGVEPGLIACDMHPDYLSTRWARAEHRRRLEAGEDCELVEVQHHHAHAAACLAEHGRTGPALALVFDGTGHGTDGTSWGGELLRFDLEACERVAHLEPIRLPGGEAAIREPWRSAAAYLEAAGRPVEFERWPLVRESLKANAPLSSGMGRLFDAVAALLGLRQEVAYEGEAAIELEWLAASQIAEPYSCRMEGARICGSDLVAAAHDDLAAGRSRCEIAAAFHEGVAAAAARACESAAEPRTVVLSGGTFQNLRLLASTRRRLASLGFEVLTHQALPPNDGGISYGQAAIAARRSGNSCV